MGAIRMESKRHINNHARQTILKEREKNMKYLVQCRATHDRNY